MPKKRTTISVDESLLEKAQSKGMNVSAVTEHALENKVERPQYHMLNTSKSWLDKRTEGEVDTTVIYSEGVAAQFGGFDRAVDIESGDYVISYVDGDGARAVGKALAEWREEPVNPEERIVLPIDHDEDEYHIPIYWFAVLSSGNGLSSSLLEEITGRPVYSSTHNPLSREGDHAELIADAIVGRAYRTQ